MSSTLWRLCLDFLSKHTWIPGALESPLGFLYVWKQGSFRQKLWITLSTSFVPTGFLGGFLLLLWFSGRFSDGMLWWSLKIMICVFVSIALLIGVGTQIWFALVKRKTGFQGPFQAFEFPKGVFLRDGRRLGKSGFQPGTPQFEDIPFEETSSLTAHQRMIVETAFQTFSASCNGVWSDGDSLYGFCFKDRS